MSIAQTSKPKQLSTAQRRRLRIPALWDVERVGRGEWRVTHREALVEMVARRVGFRTLGVKSDSGKTWTVWEAGGLVRCNCPDFKAHNPHQTCVEQPCKHAGGVFQAVLLFCLREKAEGSDSPIAPTTPPYRAGELGAEDAADEAAAGVDGSEPVGGEMDGPFTTDPTTAAERDGEAAYWQAVDAGESYAAYLAHEASQEPCEGEWDLLTQVTLEAMGVVL